MRRYRHFAAIVLCLGVTTFRSLGQDGSEKSEFTVPATNPLASKEEMLRDRFERFLDRVYRLQEQLAQSEPENAARLGRVLQRAGELGLSDQLESIIQALRKSNSMTEVLDAQDLWVSDADRLLAVLLERDGENEERKEEIDRAEAYKRRLADLLKEQQSLRDAAAQAGLERRMSAQLDQALQRINRLLEEQEKLSGRTEQGSSADSLENMPQEQRDLARDAQDLAKDLDRLGSLEPDSKSDSPKLQSARAVTKSAGQSAQGAAESMSQAGESLQKNDSRSAAEEQNEALEALRKAKQQLQEAKEALNADQNQDKLAETQEGLAQKTGHLSQQMQKESGSGGESGGMPQQGTPSEASSQASQALKSAQGEMDDAAGKLGEDKPDDAIPSQDRALSDLQQAKEELEKMLEQLRREDRAETLRDLEERFRDMLSKQRAINASTIRLAELGREKFQRQEQLELADMSAKEKALSQQAATCAHILEEEGTTVAFPRVVRQLSRDMQTVSDRLSAMLVGSLTQGIERDVVETLAQLLEAVKKMQEENEQQGASSESEEEDQPLLPTSAELKLLRSSQVRVNKRTVAIEATQANDSEPQAMLAKLLESTTARQAECAEIATEMRDLQNMP